MTDVDGDTAAGEPRFETDTVQADRAREQGLGVGERELNAQRDPGGVRTADGDDDADDGEEILPGDTVDDAERREADSGR